MIGLIISMILAAIERNGKCWKLLSVTLIELTMLKFFPVVVNTEHVTLQLCRKVVFNFFLVPKDWRERDRFHGEYRTCVITNL